MKSPHKRKTQSSYKKFAANLRTANAAERNIAFEEAICSIPVGKVASYGQIAEVAGYPRGHRLVARFLSSMYYSDIPWQRVVGSSGEIKVRGRSAAKQRSLLAAEGVSCTGIRIEMSRYRHMFDM